MNGLALCAGIGGIELGLALALGERYKTICYVERESYAAATLVARMEEALLDKAPIWDDLKTFDGTAWRGCVDIITGGYPCQPFSLAGKRLGASDERHLWPDIFRIVREIQPGLCFFENVPGHLSMGYSDVERDLQDAGYRVAAGLYSAAEVGASHKRERLFIMAYHGSAGLETGGFPGRQKQKDPMLTHGCRQLGNTTVGQTDLGRPGSLEEAEGEGRCFNHATANASAELGNAASTPLFPPNPNDTDAWRNALAVAPTLKPAVCGMADGASSRVDRLRACGNGVVPLVAAKAFICLAAQLGIGTERVKE